MMMAARLSFRLLVCAVFVTCGLFMLRLWSQKTIQLSGPNSLVRTLSLDKAARSSIPNQVHYVFLLAEPNADFPFLFYHYLSVYSALFFMRPDKIILTTNANDEQITRARNGSAGKWAKLIFDTPGLTLNHVEMITRTPRGVEIGAIEHRSDFARVGAVQKFGGLYIDFDAFVLRDIKALRESGFNTIGGREPGGRVNSGIFMASKNSKALRTWAEMMPERFDQGWMTHSNDLLTTIAEQLVPEGEALIMEQQAFAPGAWEDNDIKRLFEPHDDVPSNLERLAKGEPLPAPEDDRPEWAWNWNKTYILHAYRIEDTDRNWITPRSLLDRRSDFARAVYPAVKSLYDNAAIAAEEA
ncbi:hypothetical protein CDD83_2900 [Cordyceps sp. RAO-2017]|nr:hypothetical protein CDD83_2900 [Cordyceps sp. RAO-2017]